MSKPKGTRNRAALDYQDQAPALLSETRAARECLSSELELTRASVQAGQQRIREIEKQLRIIDDSIASLEAAIIEKEKREKTAAELEMIKGIIESLVARGFSTEDIIRKFEQSSG